MIIEDYKLIKEKDNDDLSREIVKLSKKGYELHGNGYPLVENSNDNRGWNKNYHCQGMVKYKKEKKDSL